MNEIIERTKKRIEATFKMLESCERIKTKQEQCITKKAR
jgi:hypothetical protein